MQNSIDIGWLDVGIREDSRLAVLDRGRLQQVMAELFNPEKQHPSLCVFLGGKNSQIKLRYDIASLGGHQPILLADGDIPLVENYGPTKKMQPGVGFPVSYEDHSAAKILIALWSRVIFIFTDVLCIFIDDISGLERIVTFLVAYLQLGSASPLAGSLLPRVIFIYGTARENEKVHMPDTNYLYRRIKENGYKDLSGLFSGTKSVYISHRESSNIVRFQRLKAMIREQIDTICSLRLGDHARLNGKHFTALFHSAIQHTLNDITSPFDIVRAIRKDRPVTTCVKPHLIHYLQIRHRAQLQLHKLAPSITSALFMDHYVPNMFGLLISPSILPLRLSPLPSGLLCRLRSNRIYLYCLLHSAQYILPYGHTLCDRCAQVFGAPAFGSEYQFTIKGCICCLYQRPLIVDVLPPTSSPTILAIDGGGVRGVIPLEFLLLVQEHLGSCPIQDVVDLAVGTSSGGLISLGLFAMSWNINDCSERFETLARRIFRERRPSLLLRQIAGSKSLLGQIARCYYDSRIFDSALKSAFGEDRRIFGATREDPPGPRRSGPRVGVVTTSISRNINGGLKYNFAGEITTHISHQIWPRAMGSTRIVSLGTGKAESSDQTPHFRHIFRDSFLRRGFDAWMSTMDTDSDWRKWRTRLPDLVRGDCHRLDVSLGNSPHAIDVIEAMEDYRNLVILQVGSARMAREAATSLLISRFFFIVDSLPENTTVPFWCYGSVHCKGPAQKIVKALESLYP
ncbi:hypothetical protein N7486_001064 [Penicillium sp. IBT 16267x]|nr:hypothetical protein N7486_001064 [Penicillium sp. IBT 16267x]